MAWRIIVAEAYNRGYVWDGKRRGGAWDKTQVPKTYPEASFFYLGII